MLVRKFLKSFLIELINMGWFSPDTEADAINQIQKINIEMRAISALIHLNYNTIDGRNRKKVREHYNNILFYGRKYDRIKARLSEIDRAMLMGASVDVWNGERVGVFTWEMYLRNVLEYLSNEINY